MTAAQYLQSGAAGAPPEVVDCFRRWVNLRPMAVEPPVDNQLAIGEIAKAAGVTASKIRYYERRNLLPAPARVAGRRRYGEEVLGLLRAIEVAQHAGFSLREIEQLVHGFEPGAAPSQRWRAFTQAKLSEVDTLIDRAEMMRTLLQRGVECDCQTLQDCELLRQQGHG